jgi:molybdate transport system ATP-binding protein
LRLSTSLASSARGRSDINRPVLHVEIRKRLDSDKSGSFNLDVDFSAGDGITILFGQSGSGKTTTLRAIAGIVTPDSGRITVGDETYFDSTKPTNVSIQKRRVGYVFQDYALFPHLTAEQNVSYGIKETTEKLRREKAHAMLALFKIEHVSRRYPQNMSGGEQQRTALARALASDPAIVLLDEPLSAVDTQTRSRLLDEIAGAQERVGIPFVYVTHNTAEAIRLGKQVVILHDGRVKQIGPPSEVFKP